MEAVRLFKYYTIDEFQIDTLWFSGFLVGAAVVLAIMVCSLAVMSSDYYLLGGLAAPALFGFMGARTAHRTIKRIKATV